jgi:YD repeat-containing protein
VTLDYGRNKSGQITKINASDTFYLPKPATASTTAYVPNKLNQYDSVGGQANTYDTNGNLLTWFQSNVKQTYTYDAAANGTTTASVTYDYDALGRRLSKAIVGGASTFYLLDGDEEVAEYSDIGTVLRRYITGPAVDDRIARAEGSATSNPTKYYYHTNHQGSVIGMTDAAGSSTQKLAYDEYGIGDGRAIPIYRPAVGCGDRVVLLPRALLRSTDRPVLANRSDWI